MVLSGSHYTLSYYRLLMVMVGTSVPGTHNCSGLVENAGQRMGCNRLLAMEVSQARVQQIGQASNGQAYPELQLVSTGPEL